MKCRCKILSTREPASDGSMVSIPVLEEYINSDACQDALRMRKMVGTLTHRSRNLQSIFPDKPTLSKTVGKDDAMIVVDDKAPAPTHVLTSLFINKEDGWLYGDIDILDEANFDELAKQNILRLKGMLKNGILPGVSAVIVGFWGGNSGTGTDTLQKCVNIKGIDITLNPSWKKATVTEILEGDLEKEFSEIDSNDYKYDGVKVKTFSTTDYAGPKTSKINGKFTKLIAKEFSSNGTVNILSEDFIVAAEQKEFTMAAVKDRLREAKMSPRMYFRRIYLNFKQLVKAMGGPEKIREEDMKILKSLFTSDMLFVLQKIHPEILKGKQINTLLGCSSVSKTARVAAQNLQMPYRMAMVESQKQGFLSKMRYTKLQEAYQEFIKSLCDDVFGNNPSQPEITEEEEGEE